MDKEYTTIKITKDTKKRLVQYKASLEIKDGVVVDYDTLINGLIDLNEKQR